MPIKGAHNHAHHHHHHHHHSHHHHHQHPHHHHHDDASVLVQLREHRADTQWRLDQATNQKIDTVAAHELENDAHEHQQQLRHERAMVHEIMKKGHDIRSSHHNKSRSDSKEMSKSSSSQSKKRRRTNRKKSIQDQMVKVVPSHFHQVDLFRGLTEDVLQQLCDHCVVRPQPKKAKIIIEGEEGDKMFVLIKGKVSVQILDTEVAVLYPITVFGERALMLGGGASASCIATEPCILASLSRASFNAAIGTQMAQELEDLTRLRAVVQNSKNERNYKVAHQSVEEEQMMSAMAMLRKTMRKKLGRMRARHAMNTARARKQWRLIQDLTFAIVRICSTNNCLPSFLMD